MKNTDVQKLKSAGFTLVELMVVVAIIGVLAAIAIPNFQKYQSKSRQSEAKLAMSAIYSAEVSYGTENSTFTACLTKIGYVGNAGGGKRYYATGFSDGTPTTCGSASPTESCLSYQWTDTGVATGTPCDPILDVRFDATSAAGSLSIQTAATLAAAGLALWSPSKTAFTAGAVGSVGGAIADQWMITETKQLTNPTVGI